METRYCIEYVNPRHPLHDNGSINVRYDRVLTLEQAEHDLTLLLSFGAKIINLYMGNVVDGKTGEWNPIPMIVDNSDYWFTIDWLKSLKERVQPQPIQEWSEEDENENERIRKNCIHFLELQKAHHAATFEIDECIALLEKQSKHPQNNPLITIGTKIRSKANPDIILNIISNDCHGDEFECSNGSVL